MAETCNELTVVIPVKQDAAALRLCLAHLQACQHVLVVGSGEGDCAEVVAREAGREYQAFHWDGNFPKKRNWVLRHHAFSTPWVLFLDADEYPTAAFWDEVRQALPGTPHAGFWLNYINYFMEKPLRHGDPCPKLALFRVGAGEYERIEEDSWSHLDMEVHEHPILTGSVGEIKAPIDHRDFRGLAHWITKHNAYADWEAGRYRQLQSAGASAWAKLTPRQQRKYRHMAKWWFPLAYFFAAYVIKRGFLDGWAGWQVALMKAQYFYWITLKIAAQGQTPPE